MVHMELAASGKLVRARLLFAAIALVTALAALACAWLQAPARNDAREARLRAIVDQLAESRSQVDATGKRATHVALVGSGAVRTGRVAVGAASALHGSVARLERLEQRAKALEIALRSTRADRPDTDLSARFVELHRLVRAADARIHLGSATFSERLELVNELSSLPSASAMISNDIAEFWAQGLHDRADATSMARYIRLGRHAIHRTTAGRDALVQLVYFGRDDEVRVAALNVLFRLKEDPVVARVMSDVARMQVPEAMRKNARAFDKDR